MANVGRAAGVLAPVLVAVVGVVYVCATLTPSAPKFCTLGLAIFERDGHAVVFEDQGEPGRGACDGSKVSSYPDRALGFDCKIRDPKGRVVEVLEPNDRNGECSRLEPVPASWRDS